MPLSEQLARYAQRRYEARLDLLGRRAGRVESLLAELPPDESLLVRYFVATLPLTDVFDCAPETLASFARHALMLRREVPSCAALPEDVFVHYVACPRVNNEPLVDCRPVLWDALSGRLRGLGETESVTEVNYWCAETATYQSTDGRTLGPLGVMAAAAGRCGEESTLLVSALRSVGIPARQLYVPFWAHCDDNHAWVEAYADGAWHYLGACEPEEALDRGWFTAASGRALMVNTTLFSDFGDEGASAIMRAGCTSVVSVTGAYAATRQLRVRVTDEAGTPAAGATVSVEVLNMASWRPLATLSTDRDGRCAIDLGSGSVRVHASLGPLMAEKDLDTGETGEVELVLAAAEGAGGWHDLDLRAPADHPAPSGELTAEQAARGRERKARADRTRRERVAALGAHASELAARAAELRPADDAATVEDVLRRALGNAEEVFSFLTGDAGPDRLALLLSLSEKDYLDLDASVLEAHLLAARAGREESVRGLEVQGLSPEEARLTWERCVLCPRVHLEHLSAWRGELPGMLAPEVRELLASDPAAAWRALRDATGFAPEQHLAKLVGTPVGALESGQASEITLRTLFVAACRSLGLAARLSPADLRAEALTGGRWVCVEGEKPVEETVTLRVTCDSRRSPVYGTDWSLARLGDAMQTSGQVLRGFHALDYWGASFEDGALELDVPEGRYRLTCTTRLPNGGQQVCERVVEVGGPCEVGLRTRVPRPEDMLQSIPLPDVARLAEGGALSLVAFLDLAAEPTEHLLNELAESARGVAAQGLPVTLVTRSERPEDPTLSRALAALAGARATVRIERDDFSELPERLARRMFANPEALPLAILVDARDAGRGPVGLFARGGYSVGTVELVLSLAALA